jgi:hypothetical protein
MKPSSFAALAALIMLPACAAQPSLDQQLIGKSPAERQAILKEACHAEAGQGGISRPGYVPHVRRMQHICDRMAQEFHPNTDK